MKKIKRRQLKIKAGIFVVALFVSIPFVGQFFKPNLPILSDARISDPSEKPELDARKPRKFRSTSHEFLEKVPKPFNPQGLAELNVSASAQFSSKQLKTIVDEVISDKHITPNQFIIVDLRQETHLFINGYPVSFFSPNFSNSWGRSTKETEQDESAQRERLLEEPVALVHYVIEKGKKGALGKTLKELETIHQVQTEEMLAKQLGVQYVRFAVSDHMRPSDEIVDEFISFVKALPKESWVHFHCRGGSGRTSTFMTMYDMIKNGKYLGKNDILARQVSMGGKNLHNTKSEDKFRNSLAAERQKFLDKFYSYVQATDGLGTQPWSVWVKKN
ncbi:MAG: hypothetical protein K2Q34_01330 [Alphaproteobacteria bacterium]|nr:hypothetical protein [Alphaproteobacteria bacterium]